MSTIKVRSCEFGDEVQALLRDYGAELVARKPTVEQRARVGEWGDHDGVEFFVAFDGDEAVGCVALRHVDDATGEVMRMYVRPSVRGKGVGRALLNAVETQAKAAGLTRLILDTMTELFEAASLYRAAGFVEIDDYNSNPVADLWFEKRL